MLAMVASSTTMSWAIEMSTRAHPRWACCPGARASVCCLRSAMSKSFGIGVERSVVAGGGREDDLVDDLGDELLVGQLTHDVHAVQDDACECGGEEVDVDTRAELAAVPGALEDGVGQGSLGANDLAPEGRREVLVPVDRGDDAGEGGHGLLVGQATHAAERRDEVASQAAGVGHLR